MNTFKVLTSSIFISALAVLGGCASTPDAAEDPEQSKSADQVEEEQAVLAAQKAEAEAMMATLVAEDKYKVISQESPDGQQAQADAPKESSEPEVTQEPVKSAEPASTAVKEKVVAAEPRKQVQKKPEPVATVSKPKVTKKLLQKALDVQPSDLPITIELWTLRKSFVSGEGLVLSTPTMQMGEGDFLSQVWLTLTPKELAINSSSDIDTGLKGVGVKLNGGKLIPFDRMDGSTVGVLEGDWMMRLADGGNLEIILGFFPDKAEDSPLFKGEASMDALSRLVPTYYKLQ